MALLRIRARSGGHQAHKCAFILLISTVCTPAAAQNSDSASVGLQPYEHTHVFTSYGNIQATQQQVYLLSDEKPMPFSFSGNVQKWTTGPSQDNLYTQMFQGLFKVNSRWSIFAGQIYQQQGSIHLGNALLGVNYSPDQNWSLNAALGLGAGYAYTYKYALQFSPQYKIPWQLNGHKVFSVETSLNYQEFSSGQFYQAIPKLNIQLSNTLPPISLGYAFGTFTNSGPTTINQYYQPKTKNGAMISASLRSSENSFFTLSYYPYNKNIIGGNVVTQDIVGATWNYKISNRLHLSLFGQYQNSRSISIDLAFGGSINFNF